MERGRGIQADGRQTTEREVFLYLGGGMEVQPIDKKIDIHAKI